MPDRLPRWLHETSGHTPLSYVIGFISLLFIGPIPVLAMSASPAAASRAAVSGDFAGLVDIGGGREMYLMCRGEGSPTVILEAGAGNDADTWDAVALGPGSEQTAVLPGVAAFTRVCAYDRPGTMLDFDRRSRSDPVPMPRGATDMAADLHALLTAAAVPGPYVLAGHSFGGLVVRLYAATYPNEVVGLVLIDAAHEDYYDQLRALLTAAQWATFTGPPEELAHDPVFERLDIDASTSAMREAAASSPLRPLPLVVLTHGRPFEWPPGVPTAEVEALWLPLQEDLATLVPDGRLVVAEQSGHFIPGDQPELVIAAIQQAIEAVRDPSSWTTQQATPTIEQSFTHESTSDAFRALEENMYVLVQTNGHRPRPGPAARRARRARGPGSAARDGRARRSVRDRLGALREHGTAHPGVC